MIKRATLGAGLAAATLAAFGPAAAATFVLVTYETPAQVAERDAPATSAGYWGRWNAAAGEMAKAGVLRGGSALRDGGARAGQAAAAAPAPMSGYFTIEAADSKAALAWAERLRAAGAVAVDVRETQPNPTMP